MGSLINPPSFDAGHPRQNGKSDAIPVVARTVRGAPFLRERSNTSYESTHTLTAKRHPVPFRSQWRDRGAQTVRAIAVCENTHGCSVPRGAGRKLLAS
jgi:hypothetical protein